MDSVDQPKQCGKHPGKPYLDLEPCCLESDHEGHCRLWIQEASGGDYGGSPYGIRTYDAEDGHVIQFLEIAAKFTSDEVAACIQYMELAR